MRVVCAFGQSPRAFRGERMITRFGWGAVVTALLAPAAFGATAVVATDRCEHGGNERHVRALRASLERRAGLEFVTDSQVRERLGGGARGSLADAERQISGARIDFFQNNLARSERTLRAAIDDLNRLSPSEDRWKALADALTLLAQVQLKDGREQDAKDSARTLLVVDRRYVPDRDTYPPSLHAFFDRVRKVVQAERTHDLVVTSRPAGLVVHINGRPLTKTPFKLKLPQGTYRLEAEYASGTGIARVVQAGELASVELNEEFEGAVVADRGPCVKTDGTREGRLVVLVRLAALLDAERAIAVREEEPSGGERYLVAALVDVRAGEETREARVRMHAGGFAPGSIDRLADFLATGEAEPPVQPLLGEVEKPAPVTEEPKPAPVEDAPRVVRVAPEPVQAPAPVATPAVSARQRAAPSRVPSYVAFGAGAALLVGAGYFFIQADGTNKDLEALRDGGQFRAGTEIQVIQLDGQLSGQRMSAAGLGAAAVGAVITGAVMWFINGEEE